MNSKFPIGWILSIIATLVIAVLTFFSANFQHEGKDVGLSIIMATVITILLLGVVFFLTKFKKVSIPLNFHRVAIFEVVLLFVFVVVAFISVLSTSHFFAVMDRKEIIQKKVKNQISQMDAMFEDYNRNVNDRVKAYDRELGSIERNKKNNYSAFVNAQLNQYDREDLVVLFKSEISCGDMQSEITNWEKDILSKTNGLGLIRLMPRIHEIDETLKNTRDALVERDSKSELGLNGPHWNYSLTIGDDIMKYFKRESDEKLSTWAIILALISAVVILLPYIAADRDGRNRGLFWELSNNRESTSSNSDSMIGGI